MSFFSSISQLQRSGRSLVLCTVVKVSGSTPRKIGAKMLVLANGDEHGEIIGSIGGGAIEHHIRSLALKSLALNQAQLITTSLRNELAMCCGGEMTVFIEPILPKDELFCFGAGHIAQALCPLAITLDFRVHIIDDRPEFLRLEAFSGAQLHDDRAFFLGSKPNLDLSYILVASHDHHIDQEIVESLIQYPVKYLGLIGSKRKALMTHKRLRAKAIDEESIKKLICPAGLSIKAQSPAEIAVAIIAQLIGVRHEASSSHCRRRPEFAHGFTKSLVAN